MFGNFRKKEDPKLSAAIDAIYEEMTTHGPDSEEYPNMLGYLERLTELQAPKRHNRVSPDQMAVVLGNLLGIQIIVAYEQKHVMTSKAKDFIIKPK